MRNVFIIHFLNQSILNYMLKYTPVKTYMNTSQRYCITKTDFYSITTLQLCCVYNFIHLVKGIHNEREISAVGGEDGQELRGKDLNHTRVSFIRRVPVKHRCMEFSIQPQPTKHSFSVSGSTARSKSREGGWRVRAQDFLYRIT